MGRIGQRRKSFCQAKRLISLCFDQENSRTNRPTTESRVVENNESSTVKKPRKVLQQSKHIPATSTKKCSVHLKKQNVSSILQQNTEADTTNPIKLKGCTVVLTPIQIRASSSEINTNGSNKKTTTDGGYVSHEGVTFGSNEVQVPNKDDDLNNVLTQARNGADYTQFINYRLTESDQPKPNEQSHVSNPCIVLGPNEVQMPSQDVNNNNVLTQVRNGSDYTQFTNHHMSDLDRLQPEEAESNQEEKGKVEKTSFFPLMSNISYGGVIREINFVVDNFDHGLSDVRHHFLSRFHQRQYNTLNQHLKQILYLTRYTGRLVHLRLQVELKYLRVLEINRPAIIEHVEVTALEVPHYPGAVMLLFKLKCGKCILHTGECRPSAEIEENAKLWDISISQIYIDHALLTQTFYDFPPCSDRYLELMYECATFLTQGKTHLCKKSIIVCGIFEFGMEFLLLRIALHFKLLIWMEEEHRKMLLDRSFGDRNLIELRALLTRDPTKAMLHVMSVDAIHETNLASYVHKFNFYNVLAIRPRSNGSHYQCICEKYPVKIVDVPNPLISDYNEINRFMDFISNKLKDPQKDRLQEPNFS